MDVQGGSILVSVEDNIGIIDGFVIDRSCVFSLFCTLEVSVDSDSFISTSSVSQLSQGQRS